MSDSPRWIGTAEAAALLGVNARAIQKRAARGSLTARRIGTGAGARWEIDVGALGASNGPQVDASASANGRITDALDVQSVDALDASNGLNGRVRVDAVDASDRVAELRAQLERERGEVAFLRGIVESDRRDMAELRAALRKALDLAPKQLTAGQSLTINPAVSIPTPIEAPQRAQTRARGKDSHPAPKGAQRPANRRETVDWDRVYADLADEIEKGANQ